MKKLFAQMALTQRKYINPSYVFETLKDEFGNN